ncbi:MAG: sensor histidine kinase [Caldisericaceae bacterium]
MTFRTKLIISYIFVVLTATIFPLLLTNIIVRNNFVQIVIGAPGHGISVLIPEKGLRFLQTLRNTLMISGTISVVIGVVVAIFNSKVITKPLKEMGNFARKISNGDYTARVDVKTQDEIGELANSLNYMADRLNDIENMRKTLVQNVSHDLRTPLSGIKGHLELISDPDFDDEEKEHSLEIIHSEVGRMEKMVEELSKLSNIDSKNFNLNLQKIDINTIAKETADLMSITIESKGLNLVQNLQKEPLYIIGDPIRIKEILFNIINNSIKFTESGYIKISTSSTKGDCIIEVEDSGVGIDEKDLPHIFERFYRGEKSRSNTSGGLGIGLTIAKELTYAQNGKIMIESPNHKGTKVTISFPLAT